MITTTIQSLADWLKQNVCSKVQLKVPDDYANDEGYSVKLVHPAAFPLYVPAKDRLPPKVPAPVPAVCVQMVETTDKLFEQTRTYSIRLVFTCWNPGTHGDETYNQVENKDALGGFSYFLRNDEEAQSYERNMEGWKDSMNFLNTALNELEKTQHFAGGRLMKESEIKFGLFSEEGDVCDYYPYWHSWITFQFEAGISQKNPAEYSKYL